MALQITATMRRYNLGDNRTLGGQQRTEDNLRVPPRRVRIALKDYSDNEAVQSRG